MNRNLIRALGIAVAAVVLVDVAPAQEEREPMVFVQKAEPGMRHMGMPAFAPQGGTYAFIGAHAGLEGKVVKGSPYSADGITETEKTLADGTKITKKTTSKIYRDSQGRTRREMTLGAVGPWSAEGDAPTTVTINDPVSGRMYMMRKGGHDAKAIDIIHSEPSVQFVEAGEPNKVFNREVKIVRRTGGEGGSHEASEEHEVHVEHNVDVDTGSGPEANVWIHKEHVGGGKRVVQMHDLTSAGENVVFMGDKGGTTEDLGERNIEGVVAKGTRVTHTIPEGKIGNDRPIKITSERWYSAELGTLVMTKTNDPMSGNVTYKLTNISRAEPDPSLFEMDEDIEVHEGHSIERPIKIEKHKGAPEGI
jgi:hypothetical protein